MTVASNMKLKCSCGSVLTVAIKLAGKLGQCGKCGTKFRIPESKTKPDSKTKTQTPASTALSTSQAKATVKSSTTKSGTPCPSCSKDMGTGTIVCISCGYHSKLKKRLKSFDGIDSNDKDQSDANFVAGVVLLPLATACIVLASILQSGVNGPTYLGYWFAFFLIVGSMVPVVRRFLWDVDMVNHAAIMATTGVAVARIAASVARGNFKIIFLVTAAMLALSLFLATRTSRNQHRNSIFVDAFGGLVAWTYYATFAVVAAIIACVFFVEPFGIFVVRGIGIVVIVLFLILFGVIAWIMDLPPGQRIRDHAQSWHDSYDSGYSSCSSCSSCGSGCGGGGGCGGGCGGCGD